jgi:hypothetical protein
VSSEEKFRGRKQDTPVSNRVVDQSFGFSTLAPDLWPLFFLTPDPSPLIPVPQML